LQIFRFTSSKPSKSAIASDEKFIRLRTNSFVRYCLKRLLDEQRCGLPDESAVPQDEAYALAVQYAENDPQMSRQETWWKIQTFYLVNDPEKPVWLFRFFSRMNEFYDVTVDAHSREILMQKGEI